MSDIDHTNKVGMISLKEAEAALEASDNSDVNIHVSEVSKMRSHLSKPRVIL